jgi:hypothetical protein
LVLERGPLSLVSTIEELLGRKSIDSGLENRDYGRRGSAALIMRHPSIRKSWHLLRRQAAVARSVGIVRSRTQAMEILFCFCISIAEWNPNMSTVNKFLSSPAYGFAFRTTHTNRIRVNEFDRRLYINSGISLYFATIFLIEWGRQPFSQPQLGGPGPCIYEYVPPVTGRPRLPLGTAFPFHRLLRLAGLRWRYLHGLNSGNLFLCSTN